MLLQENTNSRTFRFYWTATFHCGDYKARKVGVKCVLAKEYQFYIWAYDFMFGFWNCYDSVVFCYFHFSIFKNLNFELYKLFYYYNDAPFPR